MITTKIKIAPFLAEYAKIKFKVPGKEYCQFPDTDNLYHIVANLMQKRSINSPLDFGNLEIALPHQHGGKDPLYYNHISKRGNLLLEKKIRQRFWAELHDFVDERVHEHGELIKDSIFLFMSNYCIESITEDALSKNYYRWRSKTRKKLKIRKYRRK